MKLVDFHVHIDHYDEPIEILKEYEKYQIMTLFMTNLPEIFKIHHSQYKGYKNMRLALGYHPDLISHEEFPFNEKLFTQQLLLTDYIGEVGLDFSKHNLPFKEQQIKVFRTIAYLGSMMDKIFSIHSRKADKEVIEILQEFNVKKAVFHWYSGGLKLIDKILDLGYFFSVNISMLKSVHGKKILNKIPLDRIIIESDGPFTKINKKITKPSDIQEIYCLFEEFYEVDNLKEIVYNNLKTLRAKE